MAENYYIILGINSRASAEEIKEAYRKKVQKYHPDHYGPDSSNFILIQEAYNILSDPIRRKKYDNNILNQNEYRAPVRNKHVKTSSLNIEPLIPNRNRGRLDKISLINSFENFSPSFEELYNRYWNNFNITDVPKSERAENLNVEILIGPQQAKYGGQIKLMIPVRMKCSLCQGYGAVGFWDCLRCNGYGIIEEELPLIISFPGGIWNQFNKSISLS